MPALTVLNGIPAAADRALIQGTLRGAWGFGGVVVSDWGGVEGLLAQGFATDGPDAVRKAMAAGIDVDMASGFYAKYLAAEVASGRVSTTDLDAAVRRVLNLKLALGLFDAPPFDPEQAEAAALTPALREAARDTVRKSVVLLRNENDVLPLKPDTKKIAVVGPFADNAFDQLGPHEARGRSEEAVTLLKGIEERARKNNAEVRYAPGCDDLCYEDKGFADAVEAARASDVVIAVLGERREFSGEGASRAFLDFWGRQEELLEALAATGKPIVLVDRRRTSARSSPCGGHRAVDPDGLVSRHGRRHRNCRYPVRRLCAVRQAADLLAAQRRAGAAALRPPRDRPPLQSELALHAALYRRGRDAALSVRSRPDLCAV